MDALIFDAEDYLYFQNTLKAYPSIFLIKGIIFLKKLIPLCFDIPFEIN